ncbi:MULTISPECIES: phospholipase D-like domain-containing protein [Paraburkholderia]|uniref:Phosphatidylserine/phosphatidylglycerophosphate/ cardiolipin synthase-like enzyme n=2 Tax=Paraburkholderia TaxID=1822464 RepID=A0A7Y9WSL2_9BURK|nr:phospholipase D-like domain-containing protein [Paraburkholderia bryophila]NYH25163.1 phosphatidylserine/phosphatidylglycerophosphate/cardiolipin synthase-like enzyme [Paraburkholderia bryophila]
MPWFVDMTDEGPAEFHPVPCSYKPLVNGEEAFGAVYDAIMAARYSVDIICWGFQPSMYFKRNDGGASLNIGDLLIKKGLEGVRVRILCWADFWAVAQTTENSTPGLSWIRSRVFQNENNTEEEYDRAWYSRARGTIYGPTLENERNRAAAERRAQFKAGVTPTMPKPAGAALQTLPGIEMATRDFSFTDRLKIAYRELTSRSDKALNEEAIILSFSQEPSHHQKMVLVDYEAPEHSVGFVMGHNTLDAYWDNDAHSFARMHPRFGRNGATPRQDMSALVTGPILEHLNRNFCTAWKRSTDVDLLTPRKALASRLTSRPDKGTLVMAQINRTQSQEHRRDIKAMYQQTTNNASSFIYIENQYFRWPPLVDNIKAAVNRQLQWGRNTGKDGSLYLFVVTNSSEDGLDKGQVSTYRMMESLGRADTMPNVTKLQRGDALSVQQGQLETQLYALKQDDSNMYMSGALTPEDRAKLQAHNVAQEKIAQQKLNDVNQRIKENEENALIPSAIAGLKVLICTLVAPDSTAAAWMDTYVHSKIMIIDDAFLTHGSANINTRSMEVDSELNICHEHGDVTKALRKRLWSLHTKPGPSEHQATRGNAGATYARAVGDDITEAFKAWTSLIDTNRKLRNLKNEPPVASLVGFLTNTTKRSTLD